MIKAAKSRYCGENRRRGKIAAGWESVQGIEACQRSNENKMSDGGRDRASLGVEVWKSSQKWSVQRSAVRSIARLDPSMRTPSHVSGDFNIFVSFLSFLLHGFCRNRREL